MTCTPLLPSPAPEPPVPVTLTLPPPDLIVEPTPDPVTPTLPRPAPAPPVPVTLTAPLPVALTTAPDCTVTPTVSRAAVPRASSVAPPVPPVRLALTTMFWPAVRLIEPAPLAAWAAFTLIVSADTARLFPAA